MVSLKPHTCSCGAQILQQVDEFIWDTGRREGEGEEFPEIPFWLTEYNNRFCAVLSTTSAAVVVATRVPGSDCRKDFVVREVTTIDK